MLARLSARRLCRMVWSCLVVVPLVLFALPSAAFARSYSIDSVDIAATVNPDGSLDVTETRTFDFDGSFHGVYWKIPTGSYEGRPIETTITAVGEVIDGQFVPFAEGYDEQEHTYELSDLGNAIRVKLFSSHDDEPASFVISYTDTNLARRYEDTSVLYWKFVSDGWDEESRNVHCEIKLPVPEGSKVEPEENVRAWGHGPLDASLSFAGDTVVFDVPGVGTSEFAEARITFPTSWLSQAERVDESRLRDILAEEQLWADEANAKRERARLIAYGGSGIDIVATLATIAGSIFALARYRRTHKAQFDDQYFRDVPSDDHPAVLGALYRGGSPSDEDLTATLMRLTDLGAVKLELVTLESKGMFGRKKSRQDYRLTCLPQAADMELSAIDRGALTMLFLDIARRAPHHEGDPEGAELIYFSDLETVGKKHPERFHDAYESWEAKVETQVAKRRFFKSDSPTGAAIAISCAVLSILLFMATVFLMILTELWLVCIPLILLQVASCILGFVVFATCKSISDEALELRAKLEALRRWLKDFTRLEEAVPRDVVLWNRLLVMAVVLGVADEVIKQLKVAVPEIFEDPYIMRTYGWYYGYGGAGRPYRSFNTSYGDAHSVSTAKLASSSSSSGGGGGGGFSGGGGGGFGGGGGGGAF